MEGARVKNYYTVAYHAVIRSIDVVSVIRLKNARETAQPRFRWSLPPLLSRWFKAQRRA
jgi:hypothetical protein